MIKLGLTGSIAMGKSETARMFREAGVPVFDADQTVHELYSKGGEGVGPVSAVFPDAMIEGAIDRHVLGSLVLNNQKKLTKLESIVHPLVQTARQRFMEEAEKNGHDIVVLDIPLLFETGGQDNVDKIVVVSAPADIQRKRALARLEMTEEKFEAILTKQLPDKEKRANADYIVDSSRGLDFAEQQVHDIIASLKS